VIHPRALRKTRTCTAPGALFYSRPSETLGLELKAGQGPAEVLVTSRGQLRTEGFCPIAQPPENWALACDSELMFSEFLSRGDALRVSLVLKKLSALGFGGVLTGGLAVEIHLRSQGRVARRRDLNDLDLVVESFDSIPESLAEGFLFHHIHPYAVEGKTLIQLLDQEQRLRIDLFRQFGSTIKRAETLDGAAGPLRVISLEDLVARMTSLVVGHLRRGGTIDIKHADAFQRLAGLGEPEKIDIAWHDHRQSETESFADAMRSGQQLLDRHPELVIREEYSAEVEPCPHCHDLGPFRRARPDIIVNILGYG
jgi:hypothetical protein